MESDGTARIADPALGVPFAAFTFFSPDISIPDTVTGNMTELTGLLDMHIPSRDVFYAIRIDGTFPYVKARSVPVQVKPYPPLADALLGQTIFEFRNVTGTVVGFYTPSSAAGMNVLGYHLHFITSDRSRGGHVLDIATGETGWSWTPRPVSLQSLCQRGCLPLVHNIEIPLSPLPCVCREYFSGGPDSSLQAAKGNPDGRLDLLTLEPVPPFDWNCRSGPPGPDPAEVLRAAGRAATSLFNLDLDLSPFITAVKDDPVMSAIAHHLRGLKPPRTMTVFEALVDSIIEQQISLAAAHSIEKRVTRTFGDTLEWEGREYYAFPSPGRLADASPEELRACGLSLKKAEYIIGIARTDPGRNAGP